jgi:hypothetical protein
LYSDEDKIYTKIIAFDEIYNFVVQIFSFEVIFELKKLMYYSDLGHKLRYVCYIDFFSPNMTSNKKSLNYKVVDLVESYNFRINFILIRVQTKKL